MAAEEKIVVWQDVRGTGRWIVTVTNQAGVVEHEIVRKKEVDAVIVGKVLGSSLGCSVYRSTNHLKDELIQA